MSSNNLEILLDFLLDYCSLVQMDSSVQQPIACFESSMLLALDHHQIELIMVHYLHYLLWVEMTKFHIRSICPMDVIDENDSYFFDW